MQAVRLINENGQPPSEVAASDIIHVASYPDPSFSRDIIIWDDIRAAFDDDVIRVRYGTFVLPFLKGPDFKNLDPLRIAAVPGVTLDVVVRKQSGKQELSLESLKEALFGTQQESALPSSTPASITTATQTTAVEQIPVGDPVEATMKSSTKFEKPAAVTTPPPPPYRGPHNQASSPTATEGGPPGDGQLVAQPQEDAPPQISSAPQEEDVPQTRTLTVVQKTAEVELKAKLGDSEAQFILGHMYDCGQGVVQSSTQAMDWHLKAAGRGHTSAQCAVGKKYLAGTGASRDYLSAWIWLAKAANQGHPPAQNELGWMVSQGLRPRQCMDYQTAFTWYQKAAGQGHAAAQYNLGNMYYNGQELKKDYSVAFDLYLQAANQGHVSATNSLGNMYCIGHGVDQDYSKAAEWYLKAAAQGDKEAQYALAVLYEAGLGVLEDKTKAIKWYQKALDGGYTDAQKALDRLMQ